MKLARHPDERRFQIGVRMDECERIVLKSEMVTADEKMCYYDHNEEVEAFNHFQRDETEKVVQEVGWWLHVYYPLADVAISDILSQEVPWGDGVVRYFAFNDEALRDKILGKLPSLAGWKFFKEDAPAG